MTLSRSRYGFTAIILLTAMFVYACAPISVKQQIDRDDRAAFESLHFFQLTESSLFHAKAPWPTAAQHQQIGAKLSQAYTLVIDIAQAGLALQSGVKLSDEILTATVTLAKLVAEIVDLTKQGPASPQAQTQAAKAQSDVHTLVSSVTGGK